MIASNETTADRELVLTRIFDAPRELVWQAWTDPNQLIQWWGPDGFTNTFHEISVAPGGVWRFIMHAPDGTDYDNRIVYLEVVEPERLVFLHGEDKDDDPRQFHVTVTFDDRDGKNVLAMRTLFKTAEQREQTAKIGAVELGNQTLEKLAQHLRTIQ